MAYLGLAEQKLAVAVAVRMHRPRDPCRVQDDARQTGDADLESHFVLFPLQQRLVLLFQSLPQISHLYIKPVK